MKVGVVPGKFIPPHRGHLSSILIAHARVDKLYVVVCERPIDDGKLCTENELPYIDGRLRVLWLSKELQGFDNIEIVLLNEEAVGIESFPCGWEKYAKHIVKIIPEKIDVIFGGEVSYSEPHYKYFKDIAYEIIDPERSRWPISATEIRKNPIKNWDFIVGSARGFFCKKVLITGTESAGKTTLTKKLAKIYNTSRSEEYGRYYSKDHLGGNESTFTNEDFERICWLQKEQDIEAVKTSNKVTFIDTDAVATYYYNYLYLGNYNKRIEHFINPQNYSKVIYLEPNVKWVNDGIRFVSNQSERNRLDKEMKKMYSDFGFKNIVFINEDNYFDRLRRCIDVVDDLLK